MVHMIQHKYGRVKCHRMINKIILPYFLSSHRGFGLNPLWKKFLRKENVIHKTKIADSNC